MANALERLVIGDDPDAWRAAGFTVHGTLMRFGKVEVDLVGSRGPRGVLAWKLRHVDTDIDGLTTASEQDAALVSRPESAPSVDEHTNAVFGIDHVVIQTGDVDRTVSAFAALGIDERRSTISDTGAGQRRQSFLWAGRVILEVIGPVHDTMASAASIWGLAMVSSNLQTTCHVFEENLSTPRDAVQPGRKIATVRTDDLDISVPLAILSPHVAELL